jgi:hypothetical protein
MQNPAREGGVANPLEWKGVILNDHSGVVLVPAI